MTARLETATPHERRVARRLDARGEKGLAEALIRLRGVAFGGRYQLESLYAVGGEGAVYIVRDAHRPWRPIVAKLPLLPVHQPFELTSPAPWALRRPDWTVPMAPQSLWSFGHESAHLALNCDRNKVERLLLLFLGDDPKSTDHSAPR